MGLCGFLWLCTYVCYFLFIYKNCYVKQAFDVVVIQVFSWCIGSKVSSLAVLVWLLLPITACLLMLLTNPTWPAVINSSGRIVHPASIFSHFKDFPDGVCSSTVQHVFVLQEQTKERHLQDRLSPCLIVVAPHSSFGLLTVATVVDVSIQQPALFVSVFVLFPACLCPALWNVSSCDKVFVCLPS